MSPPKAKSGVTNAYDPSRARFDRWLAGSLAAAGVCLTTLLIVELLIVLPVQAPTSTPEGAHLHIAWQLRSGQAVYTDWQSGPVHLAIYGPLYYVLVGWTGKLLGVDREGLVHVGRALSLVGFAGIVALLLVSVRRVAGCRWAALLALMPLYWLPVAAARFLVSTRPDALAVMFSLAAVVLLLIRRVPTVAVISCLTAAFLLKPNAVAAALTLTFALLLTRQYRQAAILISGMLGANALIVGILQWATGGHLLQHLLAARFAPQSLHYLATFVTDFWQVRLLLAAAALGLLLLLWLARQGCFTDATRLAVIAIGVYVPISLFIAALFATRQGADVNYMIEPLVALGLLTGLLAGAARRLPQPNLRWLPRLAGLLLLASIATVWLRGGIGAARNMASFGRHFEQAMDRLAPWCRAQPEPTLSLETWLAYRSGIDGYVSDWIAYTSIVTAQPELDHVSQLVEQGHFTSVITYGGLDDADREIYQDMPYMCPRLRAALEAHYEEGRSPIPWRVYHPRR